MSRTLTLCDGENVRLGFEQSAYKGNACVRVIHFREFPSNTDF